MGSWSTARELRSDMTHHLTLGDGCSTCLHCHNWECRRYPPVLTQPAGVYMDQWRFAEWGFPTSGTRCGEFTDSPAESARRPGGHTAAG